METTIMENQRENPMENRMETKGLYRDYVGRYRGTVKKRKLTCDCVFYRILGGCIP